MHRAFSTYYKVELEVKHRARLTSAVLRMAQPQFTTLFLFHALKHTQIYRHLKSREQTKRIVVYLSPKTVYVTLCRVKS